MSFRYFITTAIIVGVINLNGKLYRVRASRCVRAPRADHRACGVTGVVRVGNRNDDTLVYTGGHTKTPPQQRRRRRSAVAVSTII